MIGKTFNELTVTGDAGRKGGKRQLVCQCKCGNTCVVDAYKLKTEATKSCGCKRNAYIREARTIHNGRGTHLYSKWNGIKRRCYNKNDKRYKNYGALGIKMCEEWQHDFSKFKSWALDNGYDDSLTIERVDVNRSYEPSNCAWVKMADQAANKRNTVRIIYKGERLAMVIAARLEGMEPKTLSSRYYRFVKRNPTVSIEDVTFDMLIPR